MLPSNKGRPLKFIALKLLKNNKKKEVILGLIYKNEPVQKSQKKYLKYLSRIILIENSELFSQANVDRRLKFWVVQVWKIGLVLHVIRLPFL